MASLNDVTITIFVEPDSFKPLVEVLKILEGLGLETNYRFQPLDIKYSEAMISNWMFVNVPVKLYTLFLHYWRLSGGK